MRLPCFVKGKNCIHFLCALGFVYVTYFNVVDAL